MTRAGKQPIGTNDLPPEIYIPLVDSLYKEGRTLLVGTLFVVGSILLTFWKTGQPLLLLCAVVFALVACIRGISMQAYARAQPGIKSNETAKSWERYYVAGAATSVALLGIWCYITFAATEDSFARLVSFSVTIAYVIGVFGRNFGSPRFVIVQILCAWAPMTAALLLQGDIYHWVFAALLIPFFVAVKFIAERLRSTLLEAVIATRKMSLLASRFDTALNNMPHGLCMFDADHRIVVSNSTLNKQFNLPPTKDLRGLSLPELVHICVTSRAIAGSKTARLIDEFEARLTGRDGSDFSIQTLDGRTLSLTFQPMETGGMVALFQDITERKIAEAKIKHLARYDPLTGLPNRLVLRDRMYEALDECRRGSEYAIHFIDLDQFKQVNDTLGHSCGDVLLQMVADRLRGITRSTDIVARFGGDEFVVLQSTVKSKDEAPALARRIVKGLGRPYMIDGHEVVIGASIGIAFAPNDGTGVDQLLKNADMALYQAKSDNRGTWRFFKPEMDIDAQARRNLELDLRNALEKDQFEVHFQPIIDLKTNRISTCEALLRWPHPERGLVSAAEFIPIAEEMGVIVEIGKRVLRQACTECRKWPADIRVAVNLSPIQFSRGNVPAIIRDTLAATDLPANRLEIEITESTLLQDTRATRAALQQLAALGVKISLDDFGTGYSSLSYLHSFPLHKVKIDRSFLQGLGANERTLTLLRGVTRLSTELGLRVAVEGIETKEQLQLISRDGLVNEAQGYLFGRAMPSDEIRRRIYALASPPIERVA